jgi:hypothetical protein
VLNILLKDIKQQKQKSCCRLPTGLEYNSADLSLSQFEASLMASKKEMAIGNEVVRARPLLSITGWIVCGVAAAMVAFKVASFSGAGEFGSAEFIESFLGGFIGVFLLLAGVSSIVILLTRWVKRRLAT